MNLPPDMPQDGPDLQLDRLLRQLAAAPPPAGLQERLLRTLGSQQDLANREGVSSVPTRVRWSTPVSFGSVRHKLRGSLLAPAAVATLLVPLALSFHRARPEALPQPATARNRATANLPLGQPLPAEAASTNGASPLSRSRRDTSLLIAGHQPRRPATPTLVDETLRAQRGTLSPEEAQALDDLHAPSHPAPPMPLTAQERLLTHMLRRNDGVQLAQLASQTDQPSPGGEKLAFQKFFDPPPRPQPEDSYSVPSQTPTPTPASPTSQGKQ